MKQVFQNLSSGETDVEEVPVPAAGRGQVLIRTTVSLISTGTERMLVEFGRSGWVSRARQQPDKLRMVLDKIQADGLLATYEAVQSKLDEPLALGYCNVGIVEAVGTEVVGFESGDRVLSNGPHAEWITVPKNLCVKIPDEVSDDAAVFSVLGAISLQGIRLADPTVGESFAVIGLGLIGLLTVQLLRANGCRVIGIDFDASRLELARNFGADVVDLSAGQDPIGKAIAFSRNRGIDGVLITASTRSSDPVSHAAQMSRKRGRIVLIGVTGLELSRAEFYEKELSFQVSCSYGPGRYDPDYEEKGQDYPFGLVRWTEQRNMEAVLDILSIGGLETSAMLTHRFPIEDAKAAYDLLADDKSVLGIALTYPVESPNNTRVPVRSINFSERELKKGSVGLSFIGAGNYAGRILIPAFKEAGANLRSLAASSGTRSVHHGKKHGFVTVTTDIGEILEDDQTDAVVIATRHDSHANYIAEALKAGKSVFCEKPICMSLLELENLQATWDNLNEKPILMVGFNRRFSPLVAELKSILDASNGVPTFIMTVNAGSIPQDHWTQDPEVGGRRVVGEACHFIDLLRFLANSPIESTQGVAAAAYGSAGDDVTSFTMRFANGAFGTVHYLANGHKSFPKERLDVFVDGRVFQVDNFRRLRVWGGGKGRSLWRQDKGQTECARRFVDSVAGRAAPPISIDEIWEVARVSIDIASELN